MRDGHYVAPLLKAESGSEEQFRTIFERYPHPSWILDHATLRVLAVNETAAALFRYKPAELVGGGHFTVESAADSGTRIFAELPLRGRASTWNGS